MNSRRNRYPIQYLLVLLALFACLTPAWSALDSYYLQNGDAYLLIGENPTVGFANVRGVYALNNLTTSVPQQLYDPQDSYGISASLIYVGPGNYYKELYTFSGADTGLTDVTEPLERECRTTAQLTEGYHNVTGNLSGGIHRQPEAVPADRQMSVTPFGFAWDWGFPNGYGYSVDTNGDGTTDTFNFYPMVFQRSGGSITLGGSVGDATFCAPCNIALSPVPGRSGYYYVNTNTWYHPVERLESNTGRPMIRRESVMAKYRNLSMTQFRVDPPDGPNILYPVASVKLSEEVTVTTLAECGDPCAPGTGQYTAPGSPVPYLDVIRSGFGRSYLYSRTPSASSYTLVAKNSAGTNITVPNPNLKGDANLPGGNYTTTKFIGASARGTTEDYLYFLGNEVIEDWLEIKNFTPQNTPNIVDCAVSDQWWLNGGIIYAYDKANGQVYQFVRNESGNTFSFNIIAVGTDPDSISADGFGNLYLMKTIREPAAIANIGPSELVIASTTWGSPMPPTRYGTAFYRQLIYKGVIKRDYYGGGMTTFSAKVPLGADYFCRTIAYPNWTESSDLTDTTKWQFLSPLTRSSTPVTDQVYSELAVINVNTPPEKTGNASGQTDINGPYVLNGSLLQQAAVPYIESTPMFFQVENYPLLDPNGVNTRATNLTNVDGDAWTGGFTSAIATITYHWVVEQISDRYGIPATNPVNIFDRTDPDYNTIGLSFTAGKYNVWVQSTFTYYDYDRLVPGSTPASRAEIISPLLTALGTTNDSPYAYPGTLGWSMAQIEIASASIASFPGGAGVIMSGKWLGGSNYSYSPTSTDPTSTPVYIIEEGATWSFKLRDKAENIGTTNDRLAAILATNAPTPNDTEADPTSLDWDGPPTFKWTARLEHPVTNAGILQSADVYPNDSFSPSIEIPQALEKRFLSVPSDPVAYVLEVDVLRFYKYMTRVIVGTVQTGINPETGAPVFGPNYQNTWIRPNIQLKAQATIIVLDKTPPALTLLEPYQQQAMPAMGLIARTTGPTAESTVLWGTTGDSIQSPEGKSNPSTLQFVVADNNPFGNYSQTNTYTDSHSGLSCRHNVSKRAGTFIYQTATGTSLNPQIVWAHPSAPETYRDDNDSHGGSFQMQNLTVPSTLLSQTSPTAVYNSSTFSYLTYTMNLSALQHFSRDPANGNAWSGKVPMNYANNLPYYSNPTYGAWFTDSSGNTMVASWTSAGIIVIRDNKKPNVAVQAIDDKTLTARVVPFLSGTIPVGYDRTSVDKFLIAPEYTQMNETTSWGTTAINGFVSIDWPWRPGSGNAQFTFQGAGLDGAQEIGYEQDVPISFQSCISDNVSPVASMTTSWTISGGAFDSPLSIPSNPWRYLFRQAATYTMSLSLNDTARGWPSDPANPYSTAEAAPNDRTLNIVIPISATRLDLRVIEKQMR